MNDIKCVTIPAEIADAIEYLRKDCNVWDDAIIRNCFDGSYVKSTCCVRALLGKYAQENPSVAVSAIINGYEREMTVEERMHKNIREWYDALGREQVGATESRHLREIAYKQRAAIGTTLNMLGIKIEGVNV